jgi:hypothetical protein
MKAIGAGFQDFGMVNVRDHPVASALAVVAADIFTEL